jgi:hypothetical protein
VSLLSIKWHNDCGGPAMVCHRASRRRLVQKEIVSPAPSQHPAGLLLFQTVALGAELGSLFQHPAEQRLSRGGGYAGALELQNLIALP